MDGKTTLPLLDGLSDEEREGGLMFMSVMGSFYLVAHPDYVRTVRIVPRGPESIDLVIDWLLPASAGEPDADTIELITALPMLVIKQDGEACELNQQGLRNKGFGGGSALTQRVHRPRQSQRRPGVTKRLKKSDTDTVARSVNSPASKNEPRQ